jgi:hypothetical protein
MLRQVKIHASIQNFWSMFLGGQRVHEFLGGKKAVGEEIGLRLNDFNVP